jgi:hypothetical protein
MKKNYALLIFLLLSCSLAVAQKVTLTPTTVNGANFSAGPINLASTPNSTISLGVKVEFPTGAAVSDYGTLKIYYSKAVALGANVAGGGDMGFLYFGGGKVATKSFVINLNWTDFSTSGGYIYAEYKNNTVYKSSNIAIIKNATMTGGVTLNPPADAPNPKDIINTLCCDQTIRLGDKPAPIVGSQYLNPYNNLPVGINSQWSNTSNGGIPTLDDVNRILHLEYTAELKDIKVNRKLGYLYYNDFPYKSNEVTITVVPSPILSNTISTTDVPNSNGYYELSDLKKLNLSGFASNVNLNILQDPKHTIQRGDNIVDIEKYRWEYKDNKLNSNPWITIPNETHENLNFSNPSELSNLEDSKYLVRRIAVYKNISRVSNEIKILVRRLGLNNTICCDQILKIQSENNFENPQIIMGSTPNVDNSIQQENNFQILSTSYQWQSQNNEGARTTSSWSDISDGIFKDYIPSQPLKVVFNRRGEYNFQPSYKYRRIATIKYSFVTDATIYKTVTSYSNESFLIGTNSTPLIQIYPNPASSLLNIESVIHILDAKVTITNILGNIVNSNVYSVLNPNTISINVANLAVGTYFITIENQRLGIVQKAFVKQ